MDVYNDKKFRKEAEEVYLKLCDASAQSFGVSSEQSLWRISNANEGIEESVLEQDKMMLKVRRVFV